MNVGAPWPSLDEAKPRVLGIQTKLHRWAVDDEDRRFDDLFNLVTDPGVLRVAWERVRTNRGARTSGVDGMTARYIREIRGEEQFLTDLRSDLRSGRFVPVPVRERMIPKSGGRLRRLGIPTVRDRVAQVALKLVLEPIFEVDFRPCSYGFRPKRRALDAVAEIQYLATRSYEWVLEADIEACFDTVPWNLVLKAVAHHTDQRWILLYVERWLKAPLQREDGTLVERDRGTPQGSAISPLLANMFMHYAFDAWMVREFPDVPFERYCDDIIVHARSERQALHVRAMIAVRLAECGLELNEQKTRIVYCKDEDRRGSYEHTSFTFLGYTFRPRLSKNRFGKYFLNFAPAVSNDAKTAMRREMRRWRLNLRSDKTLTDLARMINIVLQGWINYYGRFYKSMLYPVFRHLNDTLVRWAMRKYKRLRRHKTRAIRFIADVARRQPGLFAHWRFGVRPDGWTMGAR